MQQQSDYLLNVLGLSSPPKEWGKLQEYTLVAIKENGEQWVREHSQLCLDQWEYLLSLGV